MKYLFKCFKTQNSNSTKWIKDLHFNDLLGLVPCYTFLKFFQSSHLLTTGTRVCTEQFHGLMGWRPFLHSRLKVLIKTRWSFHDKITMEQNVIQYIIFILKTNEHLLAITKITFINLIKSSIMTSGNHTYLSCYLTNLKITFNI